MSNRGSSLHRPPIEGRGGARGQSFLNQKAQPQPRTAIASLSTPLFPSPSAIGSLSSDVELKLSLTSQPPPARPASAVQKPPAAISTQVAPSSSKAVTRATEGASLGLTHMKEETKQYKVTGVSARRISQSMFPSDDTGSRLHVDQYFRERYDININFLALPAPQAGSDAKLVYLPIEIVDSNTYGKDACVYDLGLQTQYQGKLETPSMGCWNMINKKMVDCIKVKTPLITITVAQAKQIEKTLVGISSDAKSRMERMLIVTGSYGKDKSVCETELGLISQCCQPKQAVECSKKYLENVAALKPSVKVLTAMAFSQRYRDDIKVLEPDKKSRMNVPIGGSGMMSDGTQFSPVLLHEIDAITFYLCSNAVVQGPPMYYAHLAAFHAPGGIQGAGGGAAGGAGGGGGGAAGGAGGGGGGAAGGAGGGGGAAGGAGGGGGAAGGAGGGGGGGGGGGQGGGGEEEEGEGEGEGLEEEGEEEEALEGEGGLNIHGMGHYPHQPGRHVNRRPAEPKYKYRRGYDGKRSNKLHDRAIQDARDKKAGQRNYRI